MGFDVQDCFSSTACYIIRKIVPNAVWGDTLRTHVRTGAPVVISDYSQLFAFWFDDPVPLAQIRSEIELIQEVEYTEEPQIIILESTWMPFDNPNDPLYNEQWYLYTLKAEQSWGITRGIGPNGSLGIAFADVFSCQLSGAQMHPDLINKLNVLNCGNYLSSPNHGYNVAGMSGAETDNGIFLASLGRDVNLYGFHGLSNALALIDSAVDDPTHLAYGNIDVVNNSYRSGPSPTHREYIRNLLQMGIVVTASGGNPCPTPSQGCIPPPRIQYPAAYYYDDIDDGYGGTIEARVIAAAATGPDDKIQPNYNFSPGTNPVNDPESSFIDVAAPGLYVTILRTEVDSLTGYPIEHTTTETHGTSLSAPLVAAQAALILSINPTLRVDQVYEIITRSADKVHQNVFPDIFCYPDMNTGEYPCWNQRSGYGRVNAYEALKYTIERFGGTIPASETMYMRNDTLYMWEDSYLIVEGNLNLRNVTFLPRTSSTSWEGISLRGESAILDSVYVSGAATGVSVTSHGASIYNSQFVNNTIGIATDFVHCAGPFCAPIRSNLYMERVLVDSSSTTGLYIRNATFGLDSSTIRNSGHHGVYTRNATALRFRGIVIENNAYDGLRMEANAEVDFSRIGDMIGFEGYNRLVNNHDKQVTYLPGAYLFMGRDGMWGGFNTINKKILEPSTCLVHNSSGGVLYAENNYWGTTSQPAPVLFCGSDLVDFIPYLTSDPTGGLGGGYRPANSDPYVFSASYELDTEFPSRTDEMDLVDWLRERIRMVRTQLQDNLESEDAPMHLRYLAGLHRRDANDATGEWSATHQFLEQQAILLTGDDADSLHPMHRRVAEGAVVILVESALASDNIDTADNFMTEYESLVSGSMETLALQLNGIAVDEAQGLYESALNRIDGLIVILGDDHAGLAEDLAFMATVIAAKAGMEHAGYVTGSGWLQPAGMDAGASSIEDKILPAEYALHASYPNPTLRSATLSLDLPEQAVVSVVVYDLLGRRVSTLAGGVLEAGRHDLLFDGSRLAAGVYLVVATVEAERHRSPLIFRQRVTLLR